MNEISEIQKEKIARNKKIVEDYLKRLFPDYDGKTLSTMIDGEKVLVNILPNADEEGKYVYAGGGAIYRATIPLPLFRHLDIYKTHETNEFFARVVY